MTRVNPKMQGGQDMKMLTHVLQKKQYDGSHMVKPRVRRTHVRSLMPPSVVSHIYNTTNQRRNNKTTGQSKVSQGIVSVMDMIIERTHGAAWKTDAPNYWIKALPLHL